MLAPITIATSTKQPISGTPLNGTACQKSGSSSGTSSTPSAPTTATAWIQP